MDLGLTPAVPAPDGWTSDLLHRTDLHLYTIITSVLALAITVPLVAIRIFTRIHIHRQLQTEDWLLVVGEVSFAAYIGLLLALPSQAAHEWDVTRDEANSFAFLVNILELIYIVPLLSSKSALLLQLRRIFSAASSIRNFAYWALLFLIAINVMAYVAIIIWAIVFITHQDQDYNPNCTGECHNSNYVLVATGIFNAAIDLAALCVPIWAMRSLQMTVQKKIGIAALFGVGGLACIASILRAIASFGPINDQIDQTRTSFPVFYWAAAEIAFVIAATCIPSLPQLWRRVAERHRRRAGSLTLDAAAQPPDYERRLARKTNFSLLGSASGDAGPEEAGPRSPRSPLNVAADSDVALIHERMRGLGLGMGSTQHVEGGRGPAWRASMESGLKEMPIAGRSLRGSRRSSGITKTVSVKVESSKA